MRSDSPSKSAGKATKSTAKAALTPKQEQFVAEYLIDLNATQAAIRAGYSPKTAQEQASRLLSNVMVMNLAREKRQNLQQATNITAERVLKEVAGLAFFDVRKLVNADGSPKRITDLDDETARAIQGIELQTVKDGENDFALVRKYKVADKNAALEKLMKHLGLFEKDNSQNNPAEALAKLMDMVNGSKLPLAASK
jgi:phage terminase small subunit